MKGIHVFSITKAAVQHIHFEKCIPFLLGLTLFVVPLSSSAKSIVLPFALLMILAIPANRHQIFMTIYQPWCQGAVFLFLLALIGCSYSIATPAEKLLVLSKYGKLLYLPVLVVGFRDLKARQLSMQAFMLAMFLVASISTYINIGEQGDENQIFRNHIMIGHMMVFAAYVAASICINQWRKKRFLYGGLLILFSYHTFFVNTSRTAYILYIFLMLLLLWQTLSRQQALLGMALVFSLLAVSFNYNDTMKLRVYAVIDDWKDYQQSQKDTPVGYRLQFHDFAKKIYMRHPVLGNGTAGFTAAYREEVPVPSWSRRLLEPHSQYWLTATEFGLLGLIGLFFFFISLFIATMQLSSSMRIISLGVLWPFIIGNLSDSLLFYSGSGYFFLLWMAICLGELKTSNSYLPNRNSLGWRL